ncbi:MAG: hypothetical protein JWO25_1215 [Alphaproteobacteria bacterium]|nr:hypothetical protein [Alphaproteobacteria bacterium]
MGIEMRVEAIEKAVPAESLFPSWRGRQPWRPRLQPATEALLGAHPGLQEAIAGLPFDRFEAAHGPRSSVFRYNEVPDEAAALPAGLPEALRAPWLCALLLWHIDRFEAVFARSGLDSEFALHYGDAFHRLLDQIGRDVAFADLDKDSFLKDLWLARVVMLPAFAQIWWPHSGLSARDVLRGGAGAAFHVFGRCGGRRPWLEGHTHDPVARAYWNEAGWGEALRLAALALPALPEAKGVFGTAWFYDPVIQQVSPRIAFAQDLQIGRGAFRFRIGSNEAAIANALATSAERRNRYKDGTYVPTDYSIAWSRRDLIGAYGD